MIISARYLGRDGDLDEILPIPSISSFLNAGQIYRETRIFVVKEVNKKKRLFSVRRQQLDNVFSMNTDSSLLNTGLIVVLFRNTII